MIKSKTNKQKNPKQNEKLLYKKDQLQTEWLSEHSLRREDGGEPGSCPKSSPGWKSEHCKHKLHVPHPQSRKGKVNPCAVVWGWIWVNCTPLQEKSTSLRVLSSELQPDEKFRGFCGSKWPQEPGEQPVHKGSS